jgi:hypothetical protein
VVFGGLDVLARQRPPALGGSLARNVSFAQPVGTPVPARPHSAEDRARLTGRSRARSSEAGVATLELVVVAPFLLLMFLLIADFGRVFYTAITLAHAA